MFAGQKPSAPSQRFVNKGSFMCARFPEPRCAVSYRLSPVS
jgi:hypothetical protein